MGATKVVGIFEVSERNQGFYLEFINLKYVGYLKEKVKQTISISSRALKKDEPKSRIINI